MPLAIVMTGRRVRLVAVNAEESLQGWLAAMGLVPGVDIQVLRNSCRGPFIITVKGSRMILGHGVAQKLIVE